MGKKKKKNPLDSMDITHSHRKTVYSHLASPIFRPVCHSANVIELEHMWYKKASQNSSMNLQSDKTLSRKIKKNSMW